jgi:hypothetical protein
MYRKNRYCLLCLLLILFITSITSCNRVENSRYDVIEFEDEFCFRYQIDGEEFVLFKNKNCYSQDTILNEYRIVSPILPGTSKKLLIEKYKEEIGLYDLKTKEITKIHFKDAISYNEIEEIHYFNGKILLLSTNNIISLYADSTKIWMKEYEVKIPDPDIFNFYGGVLSDTILIEAGYFPSGGCEYIKYYSLDLQQYILKECTKKVLPINNPQSPFDIFYMDITQKHIYLPNERKVGFNREYLDDYVLDLKFDTVGKALRKNIYYNGYGFSINKEDKIDYYCWKNKVDKVICFPVSFNFEKQIYKTYYDILLIENELIYFSEFEIELLKNTIIRKNNGVIKDDKVRNILSLYAFYSDYSESINNDKLIQNLNKTEAQNYSLLQRLVKQ